MSYDVFQSRTADPNFCKFDLYENEPAGGGYECTRNRFETEA